MVKSRQAQGEIFNPLGRKAIRLPGKAKGRPQISQMTQIESLGNEG